MPDVRRFIENSPICIEQLLRMREMSVPKDCDQTEFSQDRQERLDDTGTTKTASRDAAYTHGFMNVLLQICVEHVLQQPRITVVIFWSNNHKTVSALA